MARTIAASPLGAQLKNDSVGAAGWAAMVYNHAEALLAESLRRTGSDPSVLRLGPDPETDPHGLGWCTHEIRLALAEGRRERTVAPDVADRIADVFRGEGWAVQVDIGFAATLRFSRPAPAAT